MYFFYCYRCKTLFSPLLKLVVLPLLKVLLQCLSSAIVESFISAPVLKLNQAVNLWFLSKALIMWLVALPNSVLFFGAWFMLGIQISILVYPSFNFVSSSIRIVDLWFFWLLLCVVVREDTLFLDAWVKCKASSSVLLLPVFYYSYFCQVIAAHSLSGLVHWLWFS